MDMTKFTLWTIDTLIELCDSEERKQGMVTVREMLLALDDNYVKIALADVEQQRDWLKDYLKL